MLASRFLCGPCNTVVYFKWFFLGFFKINLCNNRRKEIEENENRKQKKKKKKKNDNSRLPMTGVSSDRCCHFSEAAGFTEIARSQETVLASVFCFVLLWFRSLSSVISFVFTHWLGLGKGCGAEIWRVANESRIPAQEYICNPLGVRCSASWTRLRCNCVFFTKTHIQYPKNESRPVLLYYLSF